MKDWIARVNSGDLFAPDEVRQLAEDLLSADHSDEEKADFLEAFHGRGESPREIAALASAFLQKAVPFEVPSGIRKFIDVCGTGGDKLGLFNISTAVMFVTAGAGVPVVKHGNRGVTSRSGGADVLEALGIPVELPPAKLSAMLEGAGATFLFAPRFHPAFKAIAPARKLLAARGNASVFNMLGPLLNPARPPYQLAGVFSEQLMSLYAEILPGLGRLRGWAVHGRTADGGAMDEISTLDVTMIAETSPDRSRVFKFDASEFFPRPENTAQLRGGGAEENARILSSILAGEQRGPARDIVVLNAAAALLVAEAAQDWTLALRQAEESIDSGSARRVLDGMRRIAG